MEKNIDSNLPHCVCDKGKITQVFTNLIINAIHAMEDSQGKLTIMATFESALPCPAIAVSFIDTGKGIPTENIKKLFDPFFTTKPVGKGTGLGLSICQGIVNDHGGEITVDSELNKGTCFKVTLPIKECA